MSRERDERYTAVGCHITGSSTPVYRGHTEATNFLLLLPSSPAEEVCFYSPASRQYRSAGSLCAPRTSSGPYQAGQDRAPLAVAVRGAVEKHEAGPGPICQAQQSIT